MELQIEGLMGGESDAEGVNEKFGAREEERAERWGRRVDCKGSGVTTSTKWTDPFTRSYVCEIPFQLTWLRVSMYPRTVDQWRECGRARS